MTTCLLLLVAQVMFLRPGARHSLMRLSVRMWRRPPAWICTEAKGTVGQRHSTAQHINGKTHLPTNGAP
jgi:hypothetical protein